MEIRITSDDITQLKADAIIVNLFEGVTNTTGATGAVNAALEGIIEKLISTGENKGKLGSTSVIYTFGKIPADKVILVGLGKQDQFNPEKARVASAEAIRACRRAKASVVGTVVHGAGAGGLEPELAAQMLAEGTVLALYTFRKYMTGGDEPTEIKELIITENDQSKIQAVENGARVGKIMAEATCIARDMVNEPGNTLTPTDLTERARKVAEAGGLEFEALGPQQMLDLGMGALLGVARGSRQEPRFIIMRYFGEGKDSQKPALALIGKAITFDTGGISIKPADRLEDMKGDMSGGAAVIGAMKAISELKPKINVVGIVPATENMPDGNAYKPGDILKSMSGKTIEVISTDAEGRLILADALAWANKNGLSPLVDIATLTGACSVALGPYTTGAFGNNEEHTQNVIKASREAGEKIWEMPLYDEYKELNKSDYADIKNTGGRNGGAITAAHFLGTFAGDTPWVHLDIAPTARSERDTNYLTKGGTGVGVRTMAYLVLNLALK